MIQQINVNMLQKMNKEQTNWDENPLILVSQNTAINCTKIALLGNKNCLESCDKSNLCKQAFTK